MNEAMPRPSPRHEQLQFLYMQYENTGVLERLGFDPSQFGVTPQTHNIGYTLGDPKPRGLDITNNESGSRIYITGYTDPKFETDLQEAFDIHNNQENIENRQNFYPFFVFQRVDRVDPNRKLQAYFIPKGIMPFYDAVASELISDADAQWLKDTQLKSFKSTYIVGAHLRYASDITPSDIAVLLSVASQDQAHPNNGIYPIPKTDIDLSQI